MEQRDFENTEGMNPSDSKAQAPVQSHPQTQLKNTSSKHQSSYTVGGICVTRTSQEDDPVEQDSSIRCEGSTELNSTDSESDDEDTNYAMGYAPLSQDPELNDENDDDRCLTEQSEVEAVVDLPMDVGHQENGSNTLHSDTLIEQTSSADSDSVCSSVSQLEDSE